MMILGLEVGTSNMKACVLDCITGACSTVKTGPLATNSSAREPKALVYQLVALGQNALDEQGLSWDEIPRIGVACPGQVDRESGIVTGAFNLHTWINVPLAGLIQDRTGRPVTILNDASAAAVAEFAYRDSEETIAVLTLGTGISLGVVRSGRLVVDSRRLMRSGHMIVEQGPNARPCPCGQRGCLAAYVSATAMATIASERQVSSSSVADRIRVLERRIAGGHVSESMTTADVFARAGRGDEVAIGVVEETCDYLGLACLNICQTLNSATIFLVGEMSGAQGLVGKVREAVSRREGKVLPKKCEINLASSSSCVAGAACAALNDYLRDDHISKSIPGGEGQDPLPAEPNDDAGEIIPVNVSEEDPTPEAESRGNGEPTWSSSCVAGAACAALNDYLRDDHISKSIPGGEGQDPLPAEPNDDAGEIIPVNVSEEDPTPEAESRGNGEPTFGRAACLERAQQEEASSGALFPGRLSAAPGDKRSGVGTRQFFMGVATGLFLGASFYLGATIFGPSGGRTYCY